MAETISTAYLSVGEYVIAFHDAVLMEATEPDHFLLGFHQLYLIQNFSFPQRNDMITLSEKYARKPVTNAQTEALHNFFRWLMI